MYLRSKDLWGRDVWRGGFQNSKWCILSENAVVSVCGSIPVLYTIYRIVRSSDDHVQYLY